MMLDDDPMIDQQPAPAPMRSWPGFSVSNLGPWSYQLRCDNCGKTTSPANLNEVLIGELVASHRCGPPLSTHWSEAVSLGAGYAVQFTSFAMHIEQAPYGVGAEPDVAAALDRIEEAVISRRQALEELVAQHDRYQRGSVYQVLGRPVGASDPVVPAQPFYSPSEQPQETGSCGPVYVTVGDLVAGCVLPAKPGTGEAAIGVVWAPGALCVVHLDEHLRNGRLAGELGPTEGGVVIYPGDTSPPCGECIAAEAAQRQADVVRCRGCGCTDENPCPGGCYWVAVPIGKGELCSNCLDQLSEDEIATELEAAERSGRTDDREGK